MTFKCVWVNFFSGGDCHPEPRYDRSSTNKPLLKTLDPHYSLARFARSGPPPQFKILATPLSAAPPVGFLKERGLRHLSIGEAELPDYYF